MSAISRCLAVAVLALSPCAAAAEAVRIAILPIVVHSSASEPEYVSRGISDMISSRLEQDARLRIERVDDPALATTRIGRALAAGRERGADFVLFGAFTQFGDGASLDLHCIPVLASEADAERARRIFIQSGAVGEIIPKLDEMVDRVAVYVQGSPVKPPEAPPTAVSGPAEAPAEGPAVPPAVLDAVRELGERVRALEERVYGTGESAAAEGPEAAPGS